VDTGAVQQKTPMSNSYFGEGLARFGDKLYQITWLTNEGFIYSIPNLEQVSAKQHQGFAELCTKRDHPFAFA
jgi:glutamine cyclotransferase